MGEQEEEEGRGTEKPPHPRLYHPQHHPHPQHCQCLGSLVMDYTGISPGYDSAWVPCTRQLLCMPLCMWSCKASGFR